MDNKKKRRKLSSSWSVFEAEDRAQQTIIGGDGGGDDDDEEGGNNVCKACGCGLVTSDEGFPTCISARCGMVNREVVVDHSPEWKTFSGGGNGGSGGDDKHAGETTRCGNPINPLLSESSMGCKIVCGTGGSSAASAYEMRKLRRYTEWQSIPHREKSLFNEFQYITTMAQNAGISRIFIDDAMRYHKEISAQQMFRGINRDGIKAASIYISCRVNGFPRTAQEIADIFHLDKTSTSAGCSAAVNLLHNVKRNGSSFAPAPAPAAPTTIKPEDEVFGENATAATATATATFSAASNVSTNKASSGAVVNNGLALTQSLARLELCVSSPSMFIDRFCSKLEFPQKFVYLCKFIAQKIEKEHLLPDDSTPQSVASGIIFFVAKLAKLSVHKARIRAVCNVSEVTINKCAKKLDSIRHLVVPPKI